MLTRCLHMLLGQVTAVVTADTVADAPVVSPNRLMVAVNHMSFCFMAVVCADAAAFRSLPASRHVSRHSSSLPMLLQSKITKSEF